MKTEEDLLPPGAKPGTIPTDLDQATGLERLELLGKMQGIDIFDMRPLDASRKGTSTYFFMFRKTRPVIDLSNLSRSFTIHDMDRGLEILCDADYEIQ